MNYDFTEKEQALVADVEKVAGSFAEKAPFEKRDLPAVDARLRDALTALDATGYPGLGYGKHPAGPHVLTAAMEKVAAAAPSLFLGIEMSCRLFGRILATWAQAPGLKDELLGEIAAGKAVGAVALSEAVMNIENQPLETRGVKEDEEVVVTGTKGFVINGPLADWIAVAGTFQERAALFIVEKKTPGLQFGDRQATAGYEGAAICGLTLADCRIPASRVIADLDMRDMLSRLRLWENQIFIGASLGALKAAFETARDFAKTHQTGGKPAIAFQAVAFKLSEMLTLYQTAQLFAYRAAWTSVAQPKEAESLTWCAKVFCTEASEKVAGTALQIMSADGLLAGNPAESAYRNAKLGQVCGTSTEIARVKIGDRALGIKL